MLIRIFDVGRRKMSTTIAVADDLDEDDVAEAIHRTVRKMGALMSSDVMCTWHDEEMRGNVFAGGRRVGSAEYVLPEGESNDA